jgi:hypothetical protein
MRAVACEEQKCEGKKRPQLSSTLPQCYCCLYENALAHSAITEKGSDEPFLTVLPFTTTFAFRRFLDKEKMFFSFCLEINLFFFLLGDSGFFFGHEFEELILFQVSLLSF